MCIRSLPARLALAFALALAAGTRSSLSAAPVAEKVWVFATQQTLTIDIQLAGKTRADWAASTFAIMPVGDATPITLPSSLATARTRVLPELGVTRLEWDAPAATPWSPTRPALYNLRLDLAAADGTRETLQRRIGFRTFVTQGGQFLLNGRPLFLRGLAINPPGRGIPPELEQSRAFAEDYVRFMKRHHVNIIRIPDHPVWYDVCDELGMMVFGGNYAGNALGKEDAAVDEIDTKGPPKDRDAAARWYRETKFHPISHHPSLLIYALTNETPYEGPLGEAWHAFLADQYARLRVWDSTRLFIANAGYGLGRTGDINDLHRYWGWYYSSPYTFLHLRNAPLLTQPDRIQPLTFTECVGNYGGPDGRVNLSPNHKNPISQQAWTGHATSTDQARLFHAHQSFVFRQATELFRRLRVQNPELAGVFPFTILFHDWHTIADFSEMRPRPVVNQMAASYAPLLLSWELYTTQVYAGSVLRPTVHLVNDADDFSDLKDIRVRYELRDETETVHASGEFAVASLPYYATAQTAVALPLPATLRTGTYFLHGTVERGGVTLTENRLEVFIASPGFAQSGPSGSTSPAILDPQGATTAALRRIGISVTNVRDEAAVNQLAGGLILAEDAIPALTPSTLAAVRRLAERGGRVLILRPSGASLAGLNQVLPAPVHLPDMDLDNPNYPPPARPSYQGMNINPERPDHPVFAGLDRTRLQSWSDATGWNESKPGMPAVYPVTATFVLQHKSDQARVATLANHSVGLEGLSLAEFFTGKGSLVLCGFDLVARSGLDPVADRLLANLAGYVASPDGHEPYVMIDAPITWGDYGSERGILTGITSGLMLNSRPALTGSYASTRRVVHKDGHQFAGGPGGWNTRPGLQYVPYGRRPFGPYVHGGWSGTPRPENPKDPIGEGRFHCRIPPGRTHASHLVWNPSSIPLPVTLTANGTATTVTLTPDETRRIEVPLAPGTSVVETTLRADRRIVLLETAFLAQPVSTAP